MKMNVFDVGNEWKPLETQSEVYLQPMAVKKKKSTNLSLCLFHIVKRTVEQL